MNNVNGCSFCIPPYISDENELTIRTYNEIFYRLERIAISAVDWKNLPQGLNPMIIERYLFYFGNVVFYYDEIIEQFVGLPMAGQFAWDVNSYPTVYDVVGFGGYHRTLTSQDSVIIWNNYQLTPTSEMASLLAYRLTNSLRTSDMHLELQKMGKIICVPEAQKKSAQALFKKVKNFAATIIGSPVLKEIADNTKVLDTELDFIVDKLDSHYSFLWHDALAYFGYTSMTNKQSGVGSYEVKAENAMADANKSSVIKSRKDGVKKFNEMFDMDVVVSFDEGGAGDGKLDDNAEDSYGGLNRPDQPSDISAAT